MITPDGTHPIDYRNEHGNWSIAAPITADAAKMLLLDVLETNNENLPPCTPNGDVLARKSFRVYAHDDNYRILYAVYNHNGSYYIIQIADDDAKNLAVWQAVRT